MLAKHWSEEIALLGEAVRDKPRSSLLALTGAVQRGGDVQCGVQTLDRRRRRACGPGRGGDRVPFGRIHDMSDR
jgi:hypothetical protein